MYTLCVFCTIYQHDLVLCCIQVARADAFTTRCYVTLLLRPVPVVYTAEQTCLSDRTVASAPVRDAEPSGERQHLAPT
jgi:hypothetical protein